MTCNVQTDAKITNAQFAQTAQLNAQGRHFRLARTDNGSTPKFAISHVSITNAPSAQTAQRNAQ